MSLHSMHVVCCAFSLAFLGSLLLSGCGDDRSGIDVWADPDGVEFSPLADGNGSTTAAMPQEWVFASVHDSQASTSVSPTSGRPESPASSEFHTTSVSPTSGSSDTSMPPTSGGPDVLASFAASASNPAMVGATRTHFVRSSAVFGGELAFFDADSVSRVVVERFGLGAEAVAVEFGFTIDVQYSFPSGTALAEHHVASAAASANDMLASQISVSMPQPRRRLRATRSLQSNLLVVQVTLTTHDCAEAYRIATSVIDTDQLAVALSTLHVPITAVPTLYVEPMVVLEVEAFVTSDQAVTAPAGFAAIAVHTTTVRSVIAGQSLPAQPSATPVAVTGHDSTSLASTQSSSSHMSTAATSDGGVHATDAPSPPAWTTISPVSSTTRGPPSHGTRGRA